MEDVVESVLSVVRSALVVTDKPFEEERERTIGVGEFESILDLVEMDWSLEKLLYVLERTKNISTENLAILMAESLKTQIEQEAESGKVEKQIRHLITRVLANWNSPAAARVFETINALSTQPGYRCAWATMERWCLESLTSEKPSWYVTMLESILERLMEICEEEVEGENDFIQLRCDISRLCATLVKDVSSLWTVIERLLLHLCIQTRLSPKVLARTDSLVFAPLIDMSLASDIATDNNRGDILGVANVLVTKGLDEQHMELKARIQVLRVSHLLCQNVALHDKRIYEAWLVETVSRFIQHRTSSTGNLSAQARNTESAVFDAWSSLLTLQPLFCAQCHALLIGTGKIMTSIDPDTRESFLQRVEQAQKQVQSHQETQKSTNVVPRPSTAGVSPSAALLVQKLIRFQFETGKFPRKQIECLYHLESPFFRNSFLPCLLWSREWISFNPGEPAYSLHVQASERHQMVLKMASETSPPIIEQEVVRKWLILEGLVPVQRRRAAQDMSGSHLQKPKRLKLSSFFAEKSKEHVPQQDTNPLDAFCQYRFSNVSRLCPRLAPIENVYSLVRDGGALDAKYIARVFQQALQPPSSVAAQDIVQHFLLRHSEVLFHAENLKIILEGFCRIPRAHNALFARVRKALGSELVYLTSDELDAVGNVFVAWQGPLHERDVLFQVYTETLATLSRTDHEKAKSISEVLTTFAATSSDLWQLHLQMTSLDLMLQVKSMKPNKETPASSRDKQSPSLQMWLYFESTFLNAQPTTPSFAKNYREWFNLVFSKWFPTNSKETCLEMLEELQTERPLHDFSRLALMLGN